MESEITIKKQDLQSWVSSQMELYLRNLINPKNNIYNRLEGLIVFDILNQLRKDAALDQLNMMPELYRKIYDLIPEARHFFEIHTPKDFNPFGKIDVLVSKKPSPNEVEHHD